MLVSQNLKIDQLIYLFIFFGNPMIDLIVLIKSSHFRRVWNIFCPLTHIKHYFFKMILTFEVNSIPRILPFILSQKFNEQ